MTSSGLFIKKTKAHVFGVCIICNCHLTFAR